MRIGCIISLGLVLAGCQTLKPEKLGANANPPPLSLAQFPNLHGKELAAALIHRSDERCENYLIGLVIQRNGANGALSVLGSGLGTIGGLAGTNQSANAFSALATFTTGTTRTLNDTVFQGRDMPLFYEAVKRGRKQERDGLLSSLGRFEGMGDHEVLAHITPYDLNCGLTYGVVQINQLLRQPITTASSSNPP